MNAPKLTGFDLVEAFHLSHAVATLHIEGVFDLLSRPSTVAEIASELGLDQRVLRPLLDYVSIRTGLLLRAGDSYCATIEYDRQCRFEFDQYVLTYGPNAPRCHRFCATHWLGQTSPTRPATRERSSASEVRACHFWQMFSSAWKSPRFSISGVGRLRFYVNLRVVGPPLPDGASTRTPICAGPQQRRLRPRVRRPDPDYSR